MPAKKIFVVLCVLLFFATASPASAADAAPSDMPGMIFIKGGCFEMGNTFKKYFSNEEPPHEVCVDDFYIARHEVTQGEWREVMGRNPSRFRCERCPVETVSWHDAQAFIGRLNMKTGRAYRLPTEAEWEYAAKSGGRREQWPGTNEKRTIGEYIVYHGYARNRPHPVGLKKPNGLGLYDMSGNVSEWVSDWFDSRYYEVSPRLNPTGPERGKTKVRRGGSWDVPCPERVRTTVRNLAWPGDWNDFTGFRLAHPAVKQPAGGAAVEQPAGGAADAAGSQAP